LLASDPNMCIIGGTASAPLYVPCVSPAHDAYLQALSTVPSQSTLDSIAQQLVAIQQSVEGIKEKVKQLNLSNIQVNPTSVTTGLNPSVQISITDKNSKTLFSLSLNALYTDLTYGSSIDSVVGYRDPSDKDIDPETMKALYLIPLSLIKNISYVIMKDLIVVPLFNGTNALKATPEVMKMIYYSIADGVSDQKAKDAMNRANSFLSEPLVLLTPSGKYELIPSFSKMSNAQLAGEAMIYGGYIIPVGKFIPKSLVGAVSGGLFSGGQYLIKGGSSVGDFTQETLKGAVFSWMLQGVFERIPGFNLIGEDNRPLKLSSYDVDGNEILINSATGELTNSPAKIVVLGDDFDLLLPEVLKIKPIPGYIDVVIHGDPEDFGIKFISTNGKMTGFLVDRETLTSILKEEGWKEGQPIRLLSCSSGAINQCGAQNLANKLRVNVLAPTDTLWLTGPDGYIIGPNPYTNSGYFKPFSPQLPN